VENSVSMLGPVRNRISTTSSFPLPTAMCNGDKIENIIGHISFANSCQGEHTICHQAYLRKYSSSIDPKIRFLSHPVIVNKQWYVTPKKIEKKKARERERERERVRVRESERRESRERESRERDRDKDKERRSRKRRGQQITHLPVE
jgi:hypothetical protein